LLGVRPPRRWSMSIADGLLAAIEEVNNLDKKLARDIGEHIDSQARTLQALKNEVEPRHSPQMPLGRYLQQRRSSSKSLRSQSLEPLRHAWLSLDGANTQGRQPSSNSLSKTKHHSLRHMNSCWRFGLSTADKGFVAEERLSKQRLAKALPKAAVVHLSR